MKTRMRFTRRHFILGAGYTLVGLLASGGYAFGIEPFRLRVQPYSLTPAGWPAGLRLRIAALSDIHACRPWMDAARIRAIAEFTNSLEPDLTVLLGDFTAAHRWVTGRVQPGEWAEALKALKARLGVYAILGNHDWWSDRAAQRAGKGPVVSRRALEDAGIPVLENDAVRVKNNGSPFWVAGLGDQLAFILRRDSRIRHHRGIDDLPGTLAKVTDSAPVILLAHEPDVFPRVPGRVAVTLSGHTHGGQIRLFGYSPVVPSRYGNRYAYGHITEKGASAAGVNSVARHLVVSGGLGCSIMPVRVGVPPEITVVELGA
jgi:uncharacterized protein